MLRLVTSSHGFQQRFRALVEKNSSRRMKTANRVYLAAHEPCGPTMGSSPFKSKGGGEHPVSCTMKARGERKMKAARTLSDCDLARWSKGRCSRP